MDPPSEGHGPAEGSDGHGPPTGSRATGTADDLDPAERRRRRRTRIGLAAGCGIPSAVGLGLIVVVGIVMSSLAFTFDGCSFDGDLDGDPGPGRGRSSQMLPVTVTPRTGLTDGQVAYVTSDAFGPDTVVSVGLCLREAQEPLDPGGRGPATVGPAPITGLDACDTDSGARFATDAEGHLAVALPIRRVITVDGVAHDCAEAPERCLVVAADARDLDLSGGQAVSFTPGLGPVDITPTDARPRTFTLPIAADPAPIGPAGTVVTVTAEGFVPGEPVILATCTPEVLTRDLPEVCQPADVDTAIAAALGNVGQVPDHADDRGTFTAEVPLPTTLTPYGPGLLPTTGGRGLDCAVPETCGIAVAAAADFARSAFLPVTVTR